jgi:putative ABC transport system permease protein
MAWRDPSSELWSDAAFALRDIRRSPGFALIAILTLALGSGGATAMFSVVNAVVLHPLPVPDPERIVRIYETNPNSNQWTTSDPNYLDYRDLTSSFGSFGAISGRPASLTGRGEPILLNGSGATASYFAIFGQRTLLGSVYGADQDHVGGDTHVVVLSEGIWRRVFGADLALVGKSVLLDGVSHRVLWPRSDSTASSRTASRCGRASWGFDLRLAPHPEVWRGRCSATRALSPPAVWSSGR